MALTSPIVLATQEHLGSTKSPPHLGLHGPLSQGQGTPWASKAARSPASSAQVILDRDTGRSRGFGFVEMPSTEEARAAIEALNEQTDAEAIIVARGGGSLEELWAFNDERVARAIYSSRLPVISGVGHETDFTIADFVADVRAPTPSAAAEITVPDQGELRQTLYLRLNRLGALMGQQVAERRGAIESQERVLSRLSPQAQIASHRQRIDELTRSASAGLAHQLALQRERLRGHLLHLQSLSPFATLDRGYSITRQLRTGEISARHHEGRHTTVQVSLLPLAEGGYVVDTPGIRKFGLLDAPPEEVAAYFPEFSVRAAGCRFPGCSHTHEPDCAVKSAMRRGEIPASRYDSYLKIRG